MMATHLIVDIMSVMFLMQTNEFGGNVMMAISLKLVIYLKGFILERVTKKKNGMSGSTDVLFFVYIRTSHLTKYSSIYFKEFTNMSKINHVKKVIEDLNVFRKYFRVRQEVSDEIQTMVSFIKNELQT